MPSQLHLPGFLVSEPARGQVLKREPDASKDGDLFSRLAARLLPGSDFSKFGMYSSGA